METDLIKEVNDGLPKTGCLVCSRSLLDRMMIKLITHSFFPAVCLFAVSCDDAGEASKLESDVTKSNGDIYESVNGGPVKGSRVVVVEHAPRLVRERINEFSSMSADEIVEAMYTDEFKVLICSLTPAETMDFLQDSDFWEGSGADEALIAKLCQFICVTREDDIMSDDAWITQLRGRDNHYGGFYFKYYLASESARFDIDHIEKSMELGDLYGEVAVARAISKRIQSDNPHGHEAPTMASVVEYMAVLPDSAARDGLYGRYLGQLDEKQLAEMMDEIQYSDLQYTQLSDYRYSKSLADYGRVKEVKAMLDGFLNEGVLSRASSVSKAYVRAVQQDPVELYSWAQGLPDEMEAKFEVQSVAFGKLAAVNREQAIEIYNQSFNEEKDWDKKDHFKSILETSE